MRSTIEVKLYLIHRDGLSGKVIRRLLERYGARLDKDASYEMYVQGVEIEDMVCKKNPVPWTRATGWRVKPPSRVVYALDKKSKRLRVRTKPRNKPRRRKRRVRP